MDPLAHTLVGACLAEAGLKRRTPLATATLVLGANAPDIDIASSFWGSDAALGFRRGVTHGVMAMLVLPVVLTGMMWAWDRQVRRRLRPEAEPARPRLLLALATLSVLSHPALDWLNTYGVRLLMPFDARWFYGDALFIVDPWLWLTTASAVVIAHGRGKVSTASFLVLGAACTALIVGTELTPLGAKLAWCAGLVLVFALRATGRAEARVAHLARMALGFLTLYIGAMLWASRAATEDVVRWMEGQGLRVQEVAAMPAPANPFVHEVIVRSHDRYYFVERRGWNEPTLRFRRDPVLVGPRDAVVAAALASDSVRGLRAWLRFPSYLVEQSDTGYRVTIRDVRYFRTAGTRLGTRTVRLDASLRPLGTE